MCTWTYIHVYIHMFKLMAYNFIIVDWCSFRRLKTNSKTVKLSKTKISSWMHVGFTESILVCTGHCSFISIYCVYTQFNTHPHTINTCVVAYVRSRSEDDFNFLICQTCNLFFESSYKFYSCFQLRKCSLSRNLHMYKCTAVGRSMRHERVTEWMARKREPFSCCKMFYHL